MNETPFVEANALLAVMSGNVKHARALIGDMLPGERFELSDAARILRDLCIEAPQ